MRCKLQWGPGQSHTANYHVLVYFVLKKSRRRATLSVIYFHAAIIAKKLEGQRSPFLERRGTQFTAFRLSWSAEGMKSMRPSRRRPGSWRPSVAVYVSGAAAAAAAAASSSLARTSCKDAGRTPAVTSHTHTHTHTHTLVDL